MCLGMERHSLIKGFLRSVLTYSDILWVVTVLSSQVGSVFGVSINPSLNNTEYVTVVEGGRVILPCTLDFLGDQSVIWVNPRKTLISLADRRMIDDHRISVERPYVKIWNLLIRDVRHNDSGTYECRVNTVPIQIKRVTLEVQVPPAIISLLSSDKIVIEEGHTATLVCHVIGIPPPNVTWYRRHYRAIGVVKERIGLEGEVLVIHNISRLCDDIYECYVDNGVPPAVSKAIRVVVDYAPEVILPNPKGIGQQLGKETILECQIFAHPQAMTRWTKNGKALCKNDKYDIDIFKNDAEHSVTLALRILNLTSLDYGHYECTGSNFLGEDSQTMLLYEIKPPATTKTTTTQRLHSALVNSKITYFAETSNHADPSKNKGLSSDTGVRGHSRDEGTEGGGVYSRQHPIHESHVISLNSELSRGSSSNSKGKENSWFQKEDGENKSTSASLLEWKLVCVTLLWSLCRLFH